MKNFLLGLNKLGLVNVQNIGKKTIVNSEALTFVDFENQNSRVLNFKNLFADTEEKYGLVINKDELLFADGTKEKIKNVFLKVKQDTRARKPKVGDIVEIQKCFNNDVFISMTSARWKSDLLTNFGIVKSIADDGIAEISISGSVVKLPTICLKKANGYASETIVSMLSFATKKGFNNILLPEYNYMDLTKDGKYIEYISEDRLPRFNGDFWNKDLRDKFATRKKVRSVLGKIIDNSKGIEDELISIYGNIDLNVEIISGDEIYEVFKKENVAKSGSISQSCMLNKDKSYFEIYADNAECAIVRNKDGIIVLRALVWTLVDNDNPRKTVKFLDRIYSRDDSKVPMLRAWAAKNGYLSLSCQIHSETRAVAPDGSNVKLNKYHVRLAKKEYSKYPYIDTMYIVVDGRLYCGNAYGRAHSTSGDLS